MEPYLGEIRMFGGNFAPAGWAFCDGQLLAISEHNALFTLLGAAYGGDGHSTFALPDLRGRLPLHMGTYNNGPVYPLALSGGVETVTLMSNQLPSHSHGAQAASSDGTVVSPNNAVWAQATSINAFSTASADINMAPQAVADAGGNGPHDNMMPSLCLSFIIALQGIYPSAT